MKVSLKSYSQSLWTGRSSRLHIYPTHGALQASSFFKDLMIAWQSQNISPFLRESTHAFAPSWLHEFCSGMWCSGASVLFEDSYPAWGNFGEIQGAFLAKEVSYSKPNDSRKLLLLLLHTMTRRSYSHSHMHRRKMSQISAPARRLLTCLSSASQNPSCCIPFSVLGVLWQA